MSFRNIASVLLTLQLGLAFHLTAASAQQADDTAFASLQERGQRVMGVDQYTSAHRFDDLPEGGRIELRQSQPDSAGVAAIRAHLRGIARAFTAGDFTIPGMVHAGAVPGTSIMAAKRGVIEYRFRPLDGGGEVRITTRDSEALRAIHEFLSFQRREHHAGGRQAH